MLSADSCLLISFLHHISKNPFFSCYFSPVFFLNIPDQLLDFLLIQYVLQVA